MAHIISHESAYSTSMGTLYDVQITEYIVVHETSCYCTATSAWTGFGSREPTTDVMNRSPDLYQVIGLAAGLRRSRELLGGGKNIDLAACLFCSPQYSTHRVSTHRASCDNSVPEY